MTGAKLIPAIFAIIIIAAATSQAININVTGPLLSVQLAKYDPAPTEPGKIVTVWIKAENIGSETAKNVNFTIAAPYPLKVLEETKEYGSIGTGDDILLEYRILVDNDAPAGLAKMDFYYSVGGGTFSKQFNITVSSAKNRSDLRALFVEAVPQPAQGRKTTLTVDVANAASGTAYFTIVSAETPAGKITRNQIYVGNLEADDFDSVDFDIDVTAPAGRHPVNLKFEYKDRDDIAHEANDTVYIDVISAKEAATAAAPKTSLVDYIIYLIIIAAVAKYVILPKIRRKK